MGSMGILYFPAGEGGGRGGGGGGRERGRGRGERGEDYPVSQV